MPFYLNVVFYRAFIQCGADAGGDIYINMNRVAASTSDAKLSKTIDGTTSKIGTLCRWLCL